MTVSKFNNYGRLLKNGVRLVLCVHDMPTQFLYNLMKYHKNISKDLSVMACTRFNNYGRQLHNWVSQSCCSCMWSTYSMSSTAWSSIMIISQRVIELWSAQDFITMGDNSRTQSVRVVILVRDTLTQSSTYWWSIMKITYRGLELWAAQDLTTTGDNSQNRVS